MNCCRFLSCLALTLLVPGFATATETRRWIVDTAEELLKGCLLYTSDAADERVRV